MMRLVILALALACSGCVPTLFFFGASVLWGTNGTPNVTCAACPSSPGNCGCKEPGGGFPDKIKAAVGSQAHVGNRGIPGFTTAYWIARTGSVPAACSGGGCLEATYWPPFGVDGDPDYPFWTDVPVPAPTPYGNTYAQSVALAGLSPSSSANRVCITSIGTNDWFLHGQEKFCAGTMTPCVTSATCGGPACEAKDAEDYAAVVFARYQSIITSLDTVCETMIVNTELCGTDPGDGSCPLNTRVRPSDGAPDAPFVRAYNDLIRNTYGAAVFDMDAEVVARGGEAYTPLPDTIHPTCPLLKIMAEAQLDNLKDRDIVDTGTIAACP